MIEKITAFFFSLYTALMTLFQSSGLFYIPITPKIISEAVVFDCGENYAIMWTTNIAGTGSVTVEKDGKLTVYNDTSSGSLRTTDTIHSVAIKKENLDNCDYTISTQAVFMKFGYTAIKGKTVTGQKTHFRAYNSQKTINALSISDVHENTDILYETLSHISVTPDILFLLGDITSTMVKKSSFSDGIIKVASKITSGEYPVVYIRGNHETRGEYSTEIRKYFPTDTGELYFTFDYGPISGVAVGFGEDKNDDHIEYSGLIDFSSYRNKEYDWLKSLKTDERSSVEYRIALSHGVSIDSHFGMNWENELKRIGTKFIVGGHTHVVKLSGDSNYYRYTDGGITGDNNIVLSLIKFENGNAELTAIEKSGNTVFNKTIYIGEES